jgi:hypothetical protein
MDRTRAPTQKIHTISQGVHDKVCQRTPGRPRHRRVQLCVVRPQNLILQSQRCHGPNRPNRLRHEACTLQEIPLAPIPRPVIHPHPHEARRHDQGQTHQRAEQSELPVNGQRQDATRNDVDDVVAEDGHAGRHENLQAFGVGEEQGHERARRVAFDLEKRAVLPEKGLECFGAVVAAGNDACDAEEIKHDPVEENLADPHDEKHEGPEVASFLEIGQSLKLEHGDEL